MPKVNNLRTEHCFFAEIKDTTGKCIAYCSRQKLIGPGMTEDCIGIKSETVENYVKRLNKERKSL